MNRLITKIIEIPFMIKDFFLMILGRDYFHLPENIGNYFIDKKSYYNDMRGKAFWNGRYEQDLPTLYIPSIKKHVHFPSMILQYGIGSLDVYFETGEIKMLKNVDNVYMWLMSYINEEGCIDNRFDLLEDMSLYYSSVSGMTQGLAISFLTRLKLVDSEKYEEKVKVKLPKLFECLVNDIDAGGGALYAENDKMYLCEYARKDNYVVLNGWVFGIFGMLDYISYGYNDVDVLQKYNSTLNTLSEELPKYFTSSKSWTYYDNKERLCSPVYESLHIHLMDALYKLTDDANIKDFLDRIKSGYTMRRRVYYTLIKIKDKLLDEYSYGTS